jgi:hypothetical protein
MAKRQEVEPMPEVTIGRERPFYSAILGDEIIEALALGVVPANCRPKPSSCSGGRRRRVKGRRADGRL